MWRQDSINLDFEYQKAVNLDIHSRIDRIDSLNKLNIESNLAEASQANYSKSKIPKSQWKKHSSPLYPMFLHLNEKDAVNAETTAINMKKNARKIINTTDKHLANLFPIEKPFDKRTHNVLPKPNPGLTSAAPNNKDRSRLAHIGDGIMQDTKPSHVLPQFPQFTSTSTEHITKIYLAKVRN